MEDGSFLENWIENGRSLYRERFHMGKSIMVTIVKNN